ncbi:hypothetical protein LGX01_04220 [Streptococcus mutans]|uniref:hypothetical protein n=1 Tax=Streptococcus mutans TaxID=1309 RepID=UPI0002B5057F|nr:hypothetical protein [Streptococcus mutans]EMC52195.1 hypothetical protein SMU102_01004 [Streptococcus mutans S1B]MCB4933500.1 hypothetical protein [Streptococcus mutans]MCB4943087.1 hypothetical protein [Streptococcus mutans]MCB4961063.1 hypothetical protein [Streptococcus mutans]MCB4989767.1 hypothetical protein [Streptococcus mutans]
MKVIIDLGNIWEALSAIGTIGAVVVSLYLSRKDSINKIRVSTQVTIPVGSLDKKIYTNVTITNVGRQEVIITQVGVTHSRYAKKKFAFITNMGIFNNMLPSYLKTGEFADFGYIQENLRQQFINKHLSGKKAYGYAIDSLGKIYFSKKFVLFDE